ncbi:MAG TPA: ABC transporter ATP-binding protein [Alphaproteobacteria bacterium]|nr:ABC transporter ATP-binding protein [Alphaproteobacteria bacterium]
MGPPALAAQGLSKSFRGVRAVEEASFEVPDGSLTALIGPNGAGKTTLFNLITNLLRPDSGEARFFGAPLGGLSPGEIAALGLIRTFQAARVFPSMTTLENALVGAYRNGRAHALEEMLRLPRARREERRLVERALALLDLAGLADYREASAIDLPMGAQKLLEVIRALMAEPRVLLLDEPAAGLNDSETGELAALLRAIRDSGVTLVVVEHNMNLVMGIADQVVVLDAGRVIASGAPREIQADARVIEAYIGQAEGGANA